MSDPVLRGDVRLGEGSIIQENVIIGSEEGTVIIGDEAVIRSGTVIYPQVRIGDWFRTGHYVLIREKTTIGDDVLIGTNSVVDGNCTIGDRVSVQTGVYITTNTTLEDDVFMGPCSVTSNDKYMVRGAELVGPLSRKALGSVPTPSSCRGWSSVRGLWLVPGRWSREMWGMERRWRGVRRRINHGDRKR